MKCRKQLNQSRGRGSRAASRPSCTPALSANDLGDRDLQVDSLTRFDSFENFLDRRLRYFSFQDLLDEFGQRLASPLGAMHQLPMQAFGDISQLNHLGHV